jgi:hypothetical protein
VIVGSFAAFAGVLAYCLVTEDKAKRRAAGRAVSPDRVKETV